MLQTVWTRRDTMKTLLAVGTAAVLPPLTFAARAAGKLAWAYFQADENGFRRTPVLLTGEKEAILLDGGFTLSDGRAVADAIKATGKTLTTIYVSCSDPDYYFGLRPIADAFPGAKIIAAGATVAAIKANVQAKLDVWGPQLKDNGPKVLADVVIPEVSDVAALEIEGNAIEIVTVADLKDRRYLWVPSLEAVFGGVLISSGVHVWVADEPTIDERKKWIAALDEIAARKPQTVVPSHQVAGAPDGLAAVEFTRAYLEAFNEEADQAKSSIELIAAMKRRYPDLLDVSSLELGAKVAKGEMKWG
jgi:glyoxylase-like metal-dependent hydrolase (beta-lactamase superfamily II)